MEGGVFISYRRGDTAGYAGRIYDLLNSRFPGRIFIDVGGIEPGTDFVNAINTKLDECKVLLALIGREWAAGRLDNSADFVHVEIAAGLSKGIRVIPVLLAGTPMPSESDLPSNLRALASRQALEITDSTWDFGSAKLIRIIGEELGLGTARKKRRRSWTIAGIVSAVVATLLTMGWLRSHQSPPRSITENRNSTKTPVGNSTPSGESARTPDAASNSGLLPNCLGGIWREQYDNPSTWTFTIVGDSLSIERTDHFVSGVLKRTGDSYVGDLKWGNGTTTQNAILSPTSDCSRVNTNQSWWYRK